MYNEIKKDSSLFNDSTLNYFYTAYTNKAIGLISSISDNIKQGDYTMANSINNAIIANNILEQNQQTVNTLILQKLLNSNYVYTTNDVNTLYLIGNQCPVASGNAVYQARNLLMTISNDVFEFMDNCFEEPKRSMDAINTNTDGLPFRLYPNPNNGSMIFEYSLSEASTGMFMLYDITGRVINNLSSINKNTQVD